MMFDIASRRITLVLAPVDMRCGYASLSRFAQECLFIDPDTGREVVIFVSKKKRHRQTHLVRRERGMAVDSATSQTEVRPIRATSPNAGGFGPYAGRCLGFSKWKCSTCSSRKVRVLICIKSKEKAANFSVSEGSFKYLYGTFVGVSGAAVRLRRPRRHPTTATSPRRS